MNTNRQYGTSTSKQGRHCPLKMIGQRVPNVSTFCEGENCEWYDEWCGRCAVAKIAEAVYGLNI